MFSSFARFLMGHFSVLVPDNSPSSVQSQGFSPTLEVVSPLCRYLSSFLLFRSLSLSCHFISWLSELVPKVLEFFQLCLFFEGFPPGSFRVSGPSLRPLIYFWVGLGTGSEVGVQFHLLLCERRFTQHRLLKELCLPQCTPRLPSYNVICLWVVYSSAVSMLY